MGNKSPNFLDKFTIECILRIIHHLCSLVLLYQLLSLLRLLHHKNLPDASSEIDVETHCLKSPTIQHEIWIAMSFNKVCWKNLALSSLALMVA